jgi:hypothetical protein
MRTNARNSVSVNVAAGFEKSMSDQIANDSTVAVRQRILVVPPNRSSEVSSCEIFFRGCHATQCGHVHSPSVTGMLLSCRGF